MGTGRIAVSDGELYYEAAGAGPAVVLLHGGLLDCRLWDDQFELLAGHYRVVRYDARSAGRSSTAAGDYSNDDDLAVLLDTLDLDRVALVGLSLGARIAFDFAISRPERVWAVCAVSPGVSGMAYVDPHILECERRQQEFIFAGDGFGYVEWYLRAWVDGPRRTPEQVDPMVRIRCQDMAVHNLREHVTRYGAGQEHDLVDRLADLTVPTRTLVGELDAVDIQRMADLITRDVPGAQRLDFPGVGHLINLERPDPFNDAISTFLAQALHPAR